MKAIRTPALLAATLGGSLLLSSPRRRQHPQRRFLRRLVGGSGGRIAFGPDGMLYMAIGHAGRRDSSQDLNSLNGKILRMTPDGGVPGGNPFPDSLVYSYGHRNPQGLAWAEDGTIFATEFGQNTWDELNVITAGANYGWPTVEGIAGTGDFADPVQQWEPSETTPSGMAHRDGTLFIANLRGQVLRAVPVANPSTSTTYYDGEFGRIRDVTQAPEGKLWFITNNTMAGGGPAPMTTASSVWS